MDPDLSEFVDPPKKQSCKVRTILAELDGERKGKLVAALAADQKKVTHKKISVVLRDWGHTVSDTTVRTHRVKDCSCD